MSGPNLSQYFANNPPSMFDEIVIDQTSDEPSELLAASGDVSKQHQFVTLPKSARTLNSSVPDDVRDMWKPSACEPGIPPLLTMPGVQSPNDLNDPIREAVSYLLGETEASQRKILTVDGVTQDERGLRQLIEANCFRSAVNLTSRLLTIYGQGYGRSGQPTKHSPHSLQLWFTRFALLLKLGQFDLCQNEAEAFEQLNRPDIYYEFYPEMHSGRNGSMASFSFRLLIAKLPSYLGLHKTTLDRLTDIAITCVKIKDFYNSEGNTLASTFWEERENITLTSLVNCSLSMKDFSLADFLMEKLIGQKGLDTSQRRALFSAWGRIYLQCGDVFGAERKFSEARRIRDTNTQTTEVRDLTDKGLIAVAQNDFKEALTFFQKALSIDTSNILLLNNIGVCLLYSGKLKDAIQMLERAISMNTQKCLNENILLNLCTLYELESSNDVSKKLALLKQINRHKADLNINIEYCLKLPTGNKI